MKCLFSEESFFAVFLLVVHKRYFNVRYFLAVQLVSGYCVNEELFWHAFDRFL